MSLGTFWLKAIHDRLLRMLFLVFVQSAMLSAMTAFVVTTDQCRKMDNIFCKRLRAMMKGKAHWADEHGKDHTLTNKEAIKHWRVAICETELRVRRVRMHQQWAKHPDEFKQVTAAIFGKMWVERD